MKYKELLEELKEMTEQQLDAEVMVFCNEDFDGACHLVANGLNLNTAPMGAMLVSDEVTDDFYGISEEPECFGNIQKLLDCHQPYLMVGNGSIPTSLQMV